MFKVFAAAVGAALLTLAPGVANAQNDNDAVLCVYNAITDDQYEAIAEDYLFGAGDDVARSNAAVLDKATQACSDRFKLSKERAAAARDVAIYGATVDYLTGDLTLMGVSAESVNGVLDVYDALGDDDLDRLYDDGWRSDADFMARLKALFVKAGLPEDGRDELATAYDILEVSAMADDAMLSFSLASEDIGQVQQ